MPVCFVKQSATPFDSLCLNLYFVRSTERLQVKNLKNQAKMKGQRFLREDWQCYLEEPVCSFSLFLPPAATSYKSQNHKGSQLEHNV